MLKDHRKRLEIGLLVAKDDFVACPEGKTEKNFRVCWALLVGALTLFLTVLNWVPQLKPVWQLLDGGTSIRKPLDDLRCLLVGVESYREAGFRFDVGLMEEKCAENGVPLPHYPEIWFLLSYLPWVTVGNTLYIGTVLYVLLGVTLFFLFRDDSLRIKGLALAVLVSPCVMLLWERGNNDIIIFCLVYWGSTLAASKTLRKALTGTAFLLLASFLKLYPVAAFLSLVSNRSHQRWVLFGFGLMVFTAVQLIFLRENTMWVARKTTTATHNNYGARVLVYELVGKVERQRHAEALQNVWKKLQARNDYAQLVRFLGITSQLCATFMCVIAGLLGFAKHGISGNRLCFSSRQTHLFLAGAGIYITTFVLHNNWAYRLVFLVLCVPALGTLIKCSSQPFLARFSKVLFGAIIVACWITPIFEPLEYFLIHNILHWLSACGLSFVVGMMLRTGLLLGATGEQGNTTAYNRVP